MTAVHHLVPRAECTAKHCVAIHSDEGPDPFQPLRAMATLADIVRPKRWRMRDGTWIDLVDMTDSHLTNTIAFVERNARALCRMHHSMAWDLPFPMFNGEMAQDMAEAEYYHAQDLLMGVQRVEDLPIYHALVDERNRRDEIASRLTRFPNPTTSTTW